MQFCMRANLSRAVRLASARARPLVESLVGSARRISLQMADAQTGEPRRAGWVGWAGTLEQYQLSSGASLAISVAPSAACGRLGHLHAGSVWNGAVHLAQLIEEGLLRERLRGRTVIDLGAGAGLPSLVALATAPDEDVRVSFYSPGALRIYDEDPERPGFAAPSDPGASATSKTIAAGSTSLGACSSPSPSSSP